MSNEIKVGDKVRVREDAPKLILGGCDMSQIVCTVCCVDKDIAAINVINDERSELKVWIVPTKYLVKVDAEAKEPKIKFGDRVRNIESGLIGVVDKIVYGNIAWVNGADGKRYHWKSDELELIEPTEQTEAEKSFEDQLRDVLNGVEHQDYGHPIQTAMINLDINDWDAYAADLAKEIALKVANKKMDNHPEEIGAYAVSVAKAVVEGLKRK